MPRPESQRAAAERLSAEFGKPIDRESVRHLQSKGIDLTDMDAVKHAFSMMERSPLLKGKARSIAQKPTVPGPPPIHEPGDIEKEIEKIKAELIASQDYETARTHRMRLAGLKDAFALHKEQGQYVTRESQIRDGLHAGGIIKQLILKIPSDLPQMIIGLEYSDAVTKCEDYAYTMLADISNAETYKGDRSAG